MHPGLGRMLCLAFAHPPLREPHQVPGAKRQAPPQVPVSSPGRREARRVGIYLAGDSKFCEALLDHALDKLSALASKNSLAKSFDGFATETKMEIDFTVRR